MMAVNIGAVACEKQKEIPDHLCGLENNIAGLSESINELQKRLDIVLRTRGPSCTKAESIKSDIQTQLAQKMNTFAMEILHLRKEVVSILDRLEL